MTGKEASVVGTRHDLVLFLHKHVYIVSQAVLWGATHAPVDSQGFKRRVKGNNGPVLLELYILLLSWNLTACCVLLPWVVGDTSALSAWEPPEGLAAWTFPPAPSSCIPAEQYEQHRNCDMSRNASSRISGQTSPPFTCTNSLCFVSDCFHTFTEYSISNNEANSFIWEKIQSLTVLPFVRQLYCMLTGKSFWLINKILSYKLHIFDCLVRHPETNTDYVLVALPLKTLAFIFNRIIFSAIIAHKPSRLAANRHSMMRWLSLRFKSHIVILNWLERTATKLAPKYQTNPLEVSQYRLTRSSL